MRTVSTDILAAYLLKRLLDERGKHRAQPAETLVVATIGRKIWEPVGKVITGVIVDLADRSPLFYDAEQVDCEHLFIGEVWIGIVALALRRSAKAMLVVLTDEQVDANKRILRVHVAKGGFGRKASSTSFKSPAAMWFFNP